MMIYPGDVLDTNAVIEFLTSEEALELPDKIEEVEKQSLDMIIIAVHFFLTSFHSHLCEKLQ